MKKPTPLPHQRRGLKLIEEFGGWAVIGDEMGLGKTFQSLFWAEHRRDLRPLLIICPQSLRQNWIDSAEAVLGFCPMVLTGQKSGIVPDSPAVIINFDILQYWADAICEWRPRMVIVDECHRANNPETATSKAVKAICTAKNVKSALFLSGTPIKSCPDEFFTTLNILRPDVFTDHAEYRWEYCGPKRKPWGWEFKGATKTRKLYRLLYASCLIRRLKADELQLPEKVIKQVTVPLRDPEEYARARDDIVGYLRKIDAARAAKAARAKALVRVGELKRLAAKLKARAAIDWLLNFANRREDEKFVVFVWHEKMVKALERAIHPRERVTYTGKTSSAGKRAAELRFKKNPECRFFIANISSGGVGLNLTNARFVIFLELPWVPNDVSQGIDRIHRIGQDRKCFSYFVLGENTIEEDICRLLLKKQHSVTSVIDGEHAVEESTAIYKELLEQLQQSQIPQKNAKR